MSKTTEYIKEVRAEMNYVTWPSQNQTIFYTVTVLVISMAIAYYLGLFDALFARGLEWILLRH